MKRIIYILCFFLSISSFGQQTYKVTEGELQFIVPNKGIIIKKESDFYLFRKLYNFELDNENKSTIYKFELERLTDSQYKNYVNSDTVIFANEVGPLKRSAIKNIRFTETTEDDFNQFYYLNKDMFVYTETDNFSKQLGRRNLYPFLILDFKNNKQIIYFDDGLIVPLKKELKLLLNDKQSNYITEKKVKLKAKEISMANFSEIEYYYEVDTIQKSKKVFFKSIFFKNALNKTYDSIYTSSNFIVGYAKKTIDVYNYQLKKLPLKNVRTIFLLDYFPQAQIISKNELRTINLLGQDYKIGDGPSSVDLSYQFPDENIYFKIVRNDNIYTFEGEIHKLINNSSSYGLEKINLFNTADVDTLEFASEYDVLNSVTLSTESGYRKQKPILLYSFLKNKKYNLNSFDYFLVENLNEEQQKANDKLPKNLDSLTKINNDVYYITKNNLCTYFPIKKEIKYKSIEKFQGNFARFEFPNGKKGWLSKDGKEYLDE